MELWFSVLSYVFVVLLFWCLSRIVILGWYKIGICQELLALRFMCLWCFVFTGFGFGLISTCLFD